MGDPWDHESPFGAWDARQPISLSDDEHGQLRRELEMEKRKRMDAERRLLSSRSDTQNLVASTVRAVMGSLPALPVSLPAASQPRSRMPSVGFPGAPLMFTGKDGRALLAFFATLERCFQAAGVTTDAQKVGYVPDYVNERLREWVEGLEGFRNQNYVELKKEMYEHFGNPQNQARYRREDLFAVMEEQQKKSLETAEELFLRSVHFEAIAKPLLESGKVTELEVNRAYFRTLPADLGIRVHARLKQQHPAHDTKNDPFTRVQVKEMAERELGKDWFEVQETGDPRPLTQRMAEVERKAATEDREVVPETAPPLTDLIQQLNRLNINDVNYAQVHATLVQSYPYAAHLYVAPARQTSVPLPPILRRPPPPTAAPGAEPVVTRNIPLAPTTQSDPCYYCWEVGHRMGTCQDLWSDESRGWIRRENGRVVFKDGTQLRRFGRGMREDVLGRIDAERGDNRKLASSARAGPDPLGSFLFRVDEVWEDEAKKKDLDSAWGMPFYNEVYEDYFWTEADEEERGEVERVAAVMETNGLDGETAMRAAIVAVNDKSDKRTRAARESSGPYQNGRPLRQGISDPPSIRWGPTTTIDPTPPSRMIPIERPRVNQPLPPALPPRVPEPPVTILQPARGATKGQAAEGTMEINGGSAEPVRRRSAAATRFTTDIEEMTNTAKVLEKFIGAPVGSALSWGDILGVSPGVRKGVLELLRTKRVPVEVDRKASDVEQGVVVTAVMSMAMTRSPHYVLPLPKVKAVIEGVEVMALYDTGSQINVIREDLFEEVGLVLNEENQINMKGVHGEAAKSKGCCENVNIPFGSATTRGHYHVFEKAPFQIILGQPWIRDHVITTTEDGSAYKLLIRDFIDPNIRVSVIVRRDPRMEGVPPSANIVEALTMNVTKLEELPSALTAADYQELTEAEVEEVDVTGDLALSFPGPLADWA